MILLTGAGGFIGGRLAHKLAERFGPENLTLLTSRPIDGFNCVVHQEYTFGSGELPAGISTVIHAGAFTPKSNETRNDVDGAWSNIRNTHHLCRTLPGVDRFIFLSTLDVYGPAECIDEQTPIRPYSLYGDSKYFCEQMVRHWAEENDTICQVLRIGHTYGPGEEAYQKLIPATMKRLLDKKAPILYGDGGSLRSFIYIDDVAEMILRSLELGSSLDPINIVGGRRTSIRELVDMIISVSGSERRAETRESDVPNRDLVFDNSRMVELLGPEITDLENGLRTEWEYLKELNEN